MMKPKKAIIRLLAAMLRPLLAELLSPMVAEMVQKSLLEAFGAGPTIPPLPYLPNRVDIGVMKTDLPPSLQPPPLSIEPPPYKGKP